MTDTTVTFAAEDVWKVARALIERPVCIDDSGWNVREYCNHCDATRDYWNVGTKPFPHKPDCVVLIAQDLLTGASHD